MRWLPSFILCLIVALMPWRLRQWTITVMAAWSQAMYFTYYSVIKFLMKKLEG